MTTATNIPMYNETLELESQRTTLSRERDEALRKTKLMPAHFLASAAMLAGGILLSGPLAGVLIGLANFPLQRGFVGYLAGETVRLIDEDLKKNDTLLKTGNDAPMTEVHKNALFRMGTARTEAYQNMDALNETKVMKAGSYVITAISFALALITTAPLLQLGAGFTILMAACGGISAFAGIALGKKEDVLVKKGEALKKLAHNCFHVVNQSRETAKVLAQRQAKDAPLTNSFSATLQNNAASPVLFPEGRVTTPQGNVKRINL